MLLAVLATAAPAAAIGARDTPTERAIGATAPESDYVNRLKFDVATINPTLVTAGGPSTLTITGTMTNTGPDELVDLSYRVQRGEALRSTTEVHDEIANPSEPLARVPSTFTGITGSLAAGASAPFAFTTSLTGTDALDITRPGVYPVMVNVNGGVRLPAGPLEARIGELHLLLAVMSVPTTGSPNGPTGAEQGATTVRAGTPTPFNFVWPLVDEPHLGVDGVFLNDDLLSAISPGGRLAILLDGLTADATQALPPGALTLVLDPQLLDELDRMTGPYRVVATPGAAQPPVTAIAQAQVPGQASPAPTTEPAGSTAPTAPDTSTPETPASTAAGAPQEVDIPGTVAGTGQQAAASYLSRLHAVAATHPVVLLPYGDPDVVALVRAGMTADVAAAEQHGREVTQRVWGDLATITDSTAFPIDGAADGATLSTLISDGATSGLLSQASVKVPTGADGRPTTSAVVNSNRTGQGLPSVIAQTDVLGGLDKLIDDGQQTGWAMKVNSLTALLTQQAADGTATPAVFAPVRRWSPDSVALTGLVQLLSEFGRSGVISGQALADLSGTAQVPGGTDYPAAARDRELSPQYLQRVGTDRASVADLRTSLSSVAQHTDPATVLDPLDAALAAASSTAFRSDSTVGDANLTTVESTVSGIRSGVQIASAGNSYTLASSTSPLVLTLQNSTPYDVPVTVQLTGGEMVGLTVTDQPVQIIPAGRSQQVKIPTQVTRSGQFQVTATLVGPDGVAWGAPVQLTVQSSAYGALTVILMVVAGGVLVIMVALRIRQRLRGRRARIAAGRAGPRPSPAAAKPAVAQPAAAQPAVAKPAVAKPALTKPAARPADDRRLVPDSPDRSAPRAQTRQEFPS